MDPSSQFVVPTIIDVPELIVTNEDIDYDESGGRYLGGDIWINKLQFLTGAMSYIIGLGNVWRFPHLCYKYAGGAFLIAYTVVLITIGLPLFLMEIAFGQYANEGPITIWRISPAFEGIGYAMCLISAVVAIYYNMINTWIVHYFFASLTLPWASCDNSWNSAKCFLKPIPMIIVQNVTQPTSANSTSALESPVSSTVMVSTNSSLSPSTSDDINSTSIGNSSVITLAPANSSSFERIINTTFDVALPSDEYFHNNVLSISRSLNEFGSFNWDLFAALVIVWASVFVILLKNFKLSGICAVIAFFMPYIMLMILSLRALTLEGALDGVSQLFSVNWSYFNNIDIWADATTQIFFSLSPCWGGIITLASMNKFHNNFHANMILIVGLNYITSLLYSLAAFSALGYMAHYSGIQFGEVVDTGLGFIFMVYTEILANMPLASLNSFLFIGTLLLVGLISQLTVIETVVTTIVDNWPHKLRYRKPLVLVVLCGCMFMLSTFICFGNGYYLIQLIDQFAGTFSGITVGILELIAVAWVYGMENFMQDIDDMISVHRNLFPSRSYWYFLWRYLTPSLLFAILIFCISDLPPAKYRGVELPSWSIKVGWAITILCLAVIPTMALIRFLLSPRGSFLDKINYLCRPSEDWAPSSYVSGPKLLNRRQMMDDSDMMDISGSMYSSPRQARNGYTEQDQDSNDEDESNEDLKVVDGRANYIIPEEEDDTDTGLITNETNV